MTWKDSLKAIFEGVDSADQVDPDIFLKLLHINGIVADKSIEENFEALEPGKKKEVIKELWELVYQEDPGERLELYARVADGYERFFEWEEESFPPGWEDLVFGWSS